MLIAVLKKRRAALLLVIALLAMAGCTTATPSGSAKASASKALDQHVQLGLSYLGKGDRKMARTHLLKALEKDKRSAPAHNGMAMLFQLELENELADEHFRKAISYDKDFTAARNNYGVFLFQQERYEEAYRQFTAAGKDTAYDRRPQVFFSLGVTAERLGKTKEAEEAWIKAIALEPGYGMPYLELGEHFYNLQDYEKARGYLEYYDKTTRPQARSLWLDVRLSQHFGDRDRQASKGLALEKLFPGSRENQEYQEWLKHEAQR